VNAIVAAGSKVFAGGFFVHADGSADFTVRAYR
jgi:hypothetical protein